jgi:thiol-disulfide isomerase/thioredoxin
MLNRSEACRFNNPAIILKILKNDTMKQIITITLLGLLAACYSREPEKTGLEGKPFPSFSLLLSDSSTLYQTPAEPDGKPVAVLYYGTQCPYSRAQIKEITEDMGRLKDIQFYFVTTSPLAAMKQLEEEYELKKFPNIVSGRDTTRFVPNYYELVGVPYIAIYNKDKKLNKAYYGEVYSNQIIAATK